MLGELLEKDNKLCRPPPVKAEDGSKSVLLILKLDCRFPLLASPFLSLFHNDHI